MWNVTSDVLSLVDKDGIRGMASRRLLTPLVTGNKMREEPQGDSYDKKSHHREQMREEERREPEVLLSWCFLRQGESADA